MPYLDLTLMNYCYQVLSLYRHSFADDDDVDDVMIDDDVLDLDPWPQMSGNLRDQLQVYENQKVAYFVIDLMVKH